MCFNVAASSFFHPSSLSSSFFSAVRCCVTLCICVSELRSLCGCGLRVRAQHTERGRLQYGISPVCKRLERKRTGTRCSFCVFDNNDVDDIDVARKPLATSTDLLAAPHFFQMPSARFLRLRSYALLLFPCSSSRSHPARLLANHTHAAKSI